MGKGQAEGLKEIERGLPQLATSATGIAGLDDVLLGGLPAGRPTLICGGAGCGTTLLIGLDIEPRTAN